MAFFNFINRKGDLGIDACRCFQIGAGVDLNQLFYALLVVGNMSGLQDLLCRIEGL